MIGPRLTTTWTLIVRELKFGPHTVDELCHVLKLSHRWMWDVVKRGHEAGLIKIAWWDRKGRRWVPAYSLGSGRDAQKPLPQTNAESVKRYRLNSPKKYKKVHMAYYYRNRDVRIAKTREWRANNPERVQYQYTKRKENRREQRQQRDAGQEQAQGI
jgi:hypothetical protein